MRRDKIDCYLNAHASALYTYNNVVIDSVVEQIDASK